MINSTDQIPPFHRRINPNRDAIELTPQQRAFLEKVRTVDALKTGKQHPPSKQIHVIPAKGSDVKALTRDPTPPNGPTFTKSILNAVKKFGKLFKQEQQPKVSTQPKPPQAASVQSKPLQPPPKPVVRVIAVRPVLPQQNQPIQISKGPFDPTTYEQVNQDRTRLVQQAKSSIHEKKVRQKEFPLTTSSQFHTNKNIASVKEQKAVQAIFKRAQPYIQEFNKKKGGLWNELVNRKVTGEFTLKNKKGEEITFIFKPSSGKLYMRTKLLGESGAFKPVPAKNILVASLNPSHVQPPIKEKVSSVGLKDQEAVIGQYIHLMAKVKNEDGTTRYDLSRIGFPTSVSFISAKGVKQWVTMAPAEAANLDKKMKNLNDAERLYVAWQINEGIATLHDVLRILHRDLKPDNILISWSEKGEIKIKIIDFGLSSIVTENATLEALGKHGPLNYLAPELYDEKERGVRKFESNRDELKRPMYQTNSDIYESTLLTLQVLLQKDMAELQDMILDQVQEWEQTLYKSPHKYLRDLSKQIADNPITGVDPSEVRSNQITRIFLWKQHPELWNLKGTLQGYSRELIEAVTKGVSLNSKERPAANQVAEILKKEYLRLYPRLAGQSPIRRP